MKTQRHTYTVIIALILLPFLATAQSITAETIRWNSSTWFEPAASSNFDQPTTITTSSDRIVWKYAGDSVKYDMNIRNTIGSWTNVSLAGSIRFEADAGSFSAIVEFRKAGSRTFVRILVAKPEEPLFYEVEIASIEAL